MRYWMLSNFSEANEPRKEGYRCMLERFGVDPPHCMAGHHADALIDGVPINDWDGSLVVRCEEPGPLEDFPWANEHVASERLRQLWEKHAPGCAQYLPLTLMLSDGTPIQDRYWLVNWLHTVDFLDRTYSDYAASNEHTTYFDVVVNGTAIPDHKPICRMKGSPSFVVIRDDIKRAIEHAGITGCQFYSVRMLHDILIRASSQRTNKRKPK